MTRATLLAGLATAMVLLGGCATTATDTALLQARYGPMAAAKYRYRPVIEDRRVTAAGDGLTPRVRERTVVAAGNAAP